VERRYKNFKEREVHMFPFSMIPPMIDPKKLLELSRKAFDEKYPSGSPQKVYLDLEQLFDLTGSGLEYDPETEVLVHFVFDTGRPELGRDRYAICRGVVEKNGVTPIIFLNGQPITEAMQGELYDRFVKWWNENAVEQPSTTE